MHADRADQAAAPLPPIPGEKGGQRGRPNTSPLLELDNITAGYGDITVLQGVRLHVAPGEIVAIIGPNGSGKSTVLKTALGYLRPTAGQVRLAGKEIGGRPTHEIVRLGMAYVPQGRIVFAGMSVEENLELGAYTLRRDRPRVRRNRDRVYALFPRLAERRTQPAGTLSGGEQQMLAIGRALMPEPQVVLMDEPSLGLSPRLVKLVFEKLLELKRELGTTLLLVEQNAAQALQVADRAYVLELGCNKFEGTGADLLADPKVRALYLGGA
ncbi:MAG TPA: ABC transporter ATP-binding protein [Chloroflexota bacterium]|nr:ABC transporter ATP-binding protein [Chloroflexota bacterium]